MPSSARRSSASAAKRPSPPAPTKKPAAKPVNGARAAAKPVAAKPVAAKKAAKAPAAATKGAKAPAVAKAPAAKPAAPERIAPPPPATPRITPDEIARPSRSVTPPPPVPPRPASVFPPPSASSPPPRPSSPPRPSNHPPSLLPPRPYIPPGPPPVFKIGDKAVHPAHGLGEITALENREFNGAKALYYILRILDNGMKVMVPTGAVTQAGLRSVMAADEADKVLETMRAREVAVDLQPWSRRFRAYTEMIKSGSPFEVAKVLRDMHRLRFDKDLSFGERRLLDQAKSLLVKELALSKKMTEAELLAEVVQIFKT